MALASRVTDILDLSQCCGQGREARKDIRAQKRKKPREQMIPQVEPRTVDRKKQEKKARGKFAPIQFYS